MCKLRTVFHAEDLSDRDVFRAASLTPFCSTLILVNLLPLSANGKQFPFRNIESFWYMHLSPFHPFHLPDRPKNISIHPTIMLSHSWLTSLTMIEKKYFPFFFSLYVQGKCNWKSNNRGKTMWYFFFI